jgi:hypothetical protein
MHYIKQSDVFQPLTLQQVGVFPGFYSRAEAPWNLHNLPFTRPHTPMKSQFFARLMFYEIESSSSLQIMHKLLHVLKPEQKLVTVKTCCNLNTIYRPDDDCGSVEISSLVRNGHFTILWRRVKSRLCQRDCFNTQVKTVTFVSVFACARRGGTSKTEDLQEKVQIK